MSFEGNKNFSVENTNPVETPSESLDAVSQLQAKIAELKERAHKAQLNIYELPEYDALDAIVHKAGALQARQDKLTWERDPKIQAHLSNNLVERISVLIKESEPIIRRLNQIVTERRGGFEDAFGAEMAEMRDAMTGYDQEFKKSEPAPAPKKDGWWNESFRAEQAKTGTPDAVSESVPAVILAEPTPTGPVAVRETIVTPEARLEAIQQNYNRAKETWLIARQAWEEAKKMKNISAGRLHDLEVQFDLAELAYMRAKREYEKEIGVAPAEASSAVPNKKGNRFSNTFNLLATSAFFATIPNTQHAEEAVPQSPVVTEVQPTEPTFNTVTVPNRRNNQFDGVEHYTGQFDQTKYSWFANNVTSGEVAPSEPSDPARLTTEQIQQLRSFGVEVDESGYVTPDTLETIARLNILTPDQLRAIQGQNDIPSPQVEPVVGTPADGSEMRDPAVYDSNPITGIQTELENQVSSDGNFVTEYAPVFSATNETVVRTSPEVLENPVTLSDSPENDVEQIDKNGVGDAFHEHVKSLLESYSNLPPQLVDRLYHEQYRRFLEDPTVIGLPADTDFTQMPDLSEVDFTVLKEDLERNLRGVHEAQTKSPYPEVTPEPDSNLTNMLRDYFPEYVPGFAGLSAELQSTIVNDIIKQLEDDRDLQIEARLFDGVHWVKPTESYKLEVAARIAEQRVQELTVADQASLQGENAANEVEAEPSSEVIQVPDATAEVVRDAIDTPETPLSPMTDNAALKITPIHTAGIEELKQLGDDVRDVLENTQPSSPGDESQTSKSAETPEAGTEEVESQSTKQADESQVVTEKITTPTERYEALLDSIGVKKPGKLDSIFGFMDQRTREFEKLKRLTVAQIRDIVLRTKPGGERSRELLAYNIGDFELFNDVYQLCIKNIDPNIPESVTVEERLRNIAKNNT